MAENSGDLSLGYMMGQSDGGNSGGGFGGAFGEGLWAVIILAILFGRGGFGNDNSGSNGFGGFGIAPWATQADVRAAVDQQTLISKIDQQTYGMADSFTSLNGAITNGFHGVDNAVCTLGYNVQSGFNSLGHQISDCCCTTQRAIDGVRYDMATQFCALGNAINTQTRDITDTVRDGFARLEAQNNARYISELERKLNNCDRDSALQGLGNFLVSELRPCPKPAYITCNPYAASWGTGYSNSGCGCGC